MYNTKIKGYQELRNPQLAQIIIAWLKSLCTSGWDNSIFLLQQSSDFGIPQLSFLFLLFVFLFVLFAGFYYHIFSKPVHKKAVIVIAIHNSIKID